MTDKPDRQDGDGLRAPCRFCISTSSSALNGINGWHVECDHCGGRTGFHNQRGNAIAQWNTRAPTHDGAEGTDPNARLMPLLDLPPAEQFDIATKLAENVGYALSPDVYAAPPKPAPDAMREALDRDIKLIGLALSKGDHPGGVTQAFYRVAEAVRSSAPVPPADGAIEAAARYLDDLEGGMLPGNADKPSQVAEKLRGIPRCPSPAVAAEPVAWPNHPGVTIDAVAFVEADKRYPQVDRDSVTDLSFADKQADRLGVFIEGFKRAVEMRAGPPVRGDREAIARLRHDSDERFTLRDLLLWAFGQLGFAYPDKATEAMIDAIVTALPVQPVAPHLPQDTLDRLANADASAEEIKDALAKAYALYRWNATLENLSDEMKDDCYGFAGSVRSGAGERGSDAAEADRYYDMAGEFGNRIQRAVEVITINIGSINRSVAAELKRILDPESALSRQAPHSSSETET